MKGISLKDQKGSSWGWDTWNILFLWVILTGSFFSAGYQNKLRCQQQQQQEILTQGPNYPAKKGRMYHLTYAHPHNDDAQVSCAPLFSSFLQAISNLLATRMQRKRCISLAAVSLCACVCVCEEIAHKNSIKIAIYVCKQRKGCQLDCFICIHIYICTCMCVCAAWQVDA